MKLEPLAASDLEAFHELIVDPHVLRYLLDGQVQTLDWSRERIADSVSAHAGSRLGLWLARVDGEAIGFTGFMGLPGTGLGPELVYALREKWTGRGYARRMAEAMVHQARDIAGLESISASVDAVNARSVRILEELGFELVETKEGGFGDLRIYRLDLLARPS